MMWPLITLLVFSFFMALCLLLLWPSDRRPYADASLLALKENDEIITPRHRNKD